MPDSPKDTPAREPSLYDPLGFSDNMRKFFENFFGQNRWMAPDNWNWNATAGLPRSMSVDLTENDKSYIIRADLPGVAKDDIKVKIDGQSVSIEVETRSEKEEKKGETYLQKERHYGRLFRSFTLGKSVDEEKATAQYKDGVLELTLPKKNSGQSRQVSID